MSPLNNNKTRDNHNYAFLYRVTLRDTRNGKTKLRRKARGSKNNTNELSTRPQRDRWARCDEAAAENNRLAEGSQIGPIMPE